MLLTAEHFSTVWLAIAFVLYVPVLMAALFRVNRQKLNNELSHVFLGTCVIILVLWQIKADFPQGVSVHLLGATIMTLMFGLPLAIVGMSAVVAGTLLNTDAHWLAFALNALAGGVLPACISFLIAEIIRRSLPLHLFVYIFCTAFLGAMLAVMAVGITSTLLLVAAGVYDLDIAFRQYGFAHLLLIFPEAFITGGTISILIMERPHWVSSYDDASYLNDSH